MGTVVTICVRNENALGTLGSDLPLALPGQKTPSGVWNWRVYFQKVVSNQNKHLLTLHISSFEKLPYLNFDTEYHSRHSVPFASRLSIIKATGTLVKLPDRTAGFQSSGSKRNQRASRLFELALADQQSDNRPDM
jgi:hypothetical protein